MRLSKVPARSAEAASLKTVLSPLELRPGRIESGSAAHSSALRKARSVAR